MKSIIITYLCFCSLVTLAQKDIEISMERLSDKSIEFYCNNNTQGTKTVQLKIVRLENASFHNNKFIARPGKTRLTKLKPIDPNNHIIFENYSYRHFDGFIPKKKVEDFRYAMPIANGISAKVLHLTSVRESLLHTESDSEYKAYAFIIPNGESAHVARKGKVIKVVDEFESDVVDQYTVSRKANSIQIEHDDGTIAEYNGFEMGSILVSEGEAVITGQKLGTISRYESQNGTVQLRFYIKYLRDLDFFEYGEKTLEVGKTKSWYDFLDPLFVTTSGDVHLEKNEEYTSLVDVDLITAEFSKREKKKWLQTRD